LSIVLEIRARDILIPLIFELHREKL